MLWLRKISLNTQLGTKTAQAEIPPDFPSLLNEITSLRTFNTNWMQKMSQQQQKLFVIVRGPSGSGKSRMIKEIGKNVPVFSTDDFWMINGTYQFDEERIGEAHSWNQGRVEEAMQGSVPIVILDNTNTQFWEMKPYVQMAQQYDYETIFKEPDWHSDLKTDGKWNIGFLKRMQQRRQIPGKIFDMTDMVDGYEYNPTVESVLSSERPVSP